MQTTRFYMCVDNIDSVPTRLELDSTDGVKWFSDIYMKLNEDKCNLLVFGGISKESVSVEIGSATSNSVEEKLLGVILDRKLTFEQHVSNLCQKISNKLSAVSHTPYYMDQNTLRVLMIV